MKTRRGHVELWDERGKRLVLTGLRPEDVQKIRQLLEDLVDQPPKGLLEPVVD